ncbi:DUF2683 family protein [Helicobacter sp. MIT 05-5294]|uniref:DUF2683 family protein n=1 Tax=Helicobacter sp. MIT 05-5294 TaxID=1548150 RepID=UPI00051F9452|nr:DUF2683 family protein [Helicobacter sp. MIT 05-5294]TLD85573.1 hypothetical protein LS69_008985 [Helicobacter sp. MIT 05-5294]
MTLIIEDVKEEFLPATKAFAKAINAKCKVKKEEEVYTQDFIESLEESEREFEEQRKNKTLKTYKNVEEAFRSEGII